jgi:hypothetical protein
MEFLKQKCIFYSRCCRGGALARGSIRPCLPADFVLFFDSIILCIIILNNIYCIIKIIDNKNAGWPYTSLGPCSDILDRPGDDDSELSSCSSKILLLLKLIIEWVYSLMCFSYHEMACHYLSKYKTDFSLIINKYFY